MATFLRCFLAPRLYHVFQKGLNPGSDYIPNVVEKFSDYVVKWFRFCWSFSYYTSPVLLVIFYRRGAFTPEGGLSALSYGTSLSVILFVALWARAIGRRTNKQYVEFLQTLGEAKQVMSHDNKVKLSQYDFDFFAWPVEFTAVNDERRRYQVSHEPRRKGVVDKVKAIPCHILSYMAAHSFGMRMVYPGSTAVLQALVAPMLIQGRTKLVEEKNGTRFKLRTVDQNEIDVMFVDRRNDPLHPNGDTLVICCEGNAGFYEIGIMVTALDAGYSVIGWNHPGFYGSSGSPYPDQEQNAADAVMQFCTHKLGFPLYDITVFGWSIGGYPVTWLAMNYPEIKSVVIDASFDDILPLADAKMPPSWKTLVKLTIRKYLNLNIAEQLTKYPGPVLLIRRARDEIITTIGPTFRTSNRGNFILTKLIAFRYPKIAEGTFGVLTQWLATDSAGQSALLLEHEVDESWCESVLSSYIEEHSKSYPMFVGEDLPLESRKQLALFLATKYMEEFDATHCQPLPSQNLHQPWSEQM